ncbi:hypothetical protein IPC1241_19175 [Pseudomonas aeruginosa]|uniref:Uncharacterized protein n=1 Tax=Pseudomonas aeruginosa TaxID=287 RepID=A0A0N9ZSS9_PSEAI|nr:hypothetical protein [Pseudomonas aeruginosa]ALI58940.1 hypothetical protein CCBH4851_00236 [Pseudomonas aeruginosa]AOX32961.1 hypothetical protein PA8281_05699 [Pseudomonas aeruginosa]APB57045.1 hypothetical protein PA7790_05761 [Pseudomonas aeruginosa]ARU38919.1 hypothetical protein AL347_31430 [Pseudomonas aeruginosa]KSJ55046.1 hypothetical protein APA05_05345 [Pseudomonas aeruginosa]
MPENRSAPRERPILFSGPMVRAILEGRKTVTRRVVKPQPDFLGSMVDPNTPFKTLDAGLHARITCPYGEPGDRLWVREAWAADAQVDAIAPSDLSQGEPIWYPADLSVRQTGCSMISKGRVRPSIHMPRWACRILLEITAVRVERLQDISEEQALAEGVRGEPCDHARQACADIGCWGDTAKGAFGFLWESLNGEGSWAANPWVWVVEFKRVTP